MKILFHPIEAWGHMNATIGVAQIMFKRGHQCIFVISRKVRGQFSKYGFDEVFLEFSEKKENFYNNQCNGYSNMIDMNGNQMVSNVHISNRNNHVNGTTITITNGNGHLHQDNAINTNNNNNNNNSCHDADHDDDDDEDHVDHLIRSRLFIEKDPLKKYGMFKKVFEMRRKEILKTDKQMKNFIEKIKPDLIIVDQILVSSMIIQSGIPWCSIFSCNPISFRNDHRLPPPFSGLPSDDKTLWSIYRKEFTEKYQSAVLFNQNQMQKYYGFDPLSYDGITVPSPYLNIYGYPLELDYIDIAPMPYNCFRLETFCRDETNAKFELPLEFLQSLKSDSKLIYISMGTLAAIRFDLIKKILNILSKTRHGYIVSKGPYDDGYQFPKNIYGANYLPQTKVIPMVDLVITHGGNNTITETFLNGKPLIVMPFFVDQYDNAERIQEKGFGIRMDPFDFDGKQLINNLEKLLNDQQLKKQLKIISERIKKSNVKNELGDCLEKIVSKNHLKTF